MRLVPRLIVALCLVLPLATAAGKTPRSVDGGIRGRAASVGVYDEQADLEIPLRRALKKSKKSNKKVDTEKANVFERNEGSISSSSSSQSDRLSSRRHSHSASSGRTESTGKLYDSSDDEGLASPTPAPSTEPPILSLVKQHEREKYGALRRVTEPPTSAPVGSDNSEGGTTTEDNDETGTDTGGNADDNEGNDDGNNEPPVEQDEEKGGRQSGVDCSLNENGFFGVPSGSAYEIEFLYQIYVNEGTSLSILRSQVMDDLDIAVAESILPSFFDCNNERRNRLLQDGTIDAVSSRRPDQVVLGGLSCTGRTYPGVDCYVVQGYVSVFTSVFRNKAEVEAVVLPVIQMAMQTDVLQRANSLIVDVNAIADDLSTMNPLPTGMPVVVPPTPAPTQTPGQPTGGGEPTAEPTAEQPTGGDEPTTEPPTGGNPTGPEPTPAPTMTYKPTTTWYPTTTSYPTTSPGDEQPTSGDEPTTTPPTSGDPAPTPPATVRSAGTDTGIEKMEWWHWLLVGVGGAMILMCGLGLARSSAGGQATLGRKRSDDDNVDAVGSPNNVYKPKNAGTAKDRKDDYVPPGMENKTEDVGSFTITPGQPDAYQTNGMQVEEDEGEEDPSEEEEDIQYYEDDDDDEGEDGVVDQDMGYGDHQQDMGYGDDQPSDDMGYRDDQDMGYGDHNEDDGYDDQYRDGGDDDQYADDGPYDDDNNGDVGGQYDDNDGQGDYNDGGDYEEDDYEDVEETYYEEEEEEEETVSDSQGHAAESGWENQYAVNPNNNQGGY